MIVLLMENLMHEDRISLIPLIPIRNSVHPGMASISLFLQMDLPMSVNATTSTIEIPIKSEFVALVTKQSEKDLNRQLRENHKGLEQVKSRIAKLDTIVQRLYEDNLDGKISDERFARLSATYDAEQKELEQRQTELQEFINKSKEQALNVDSFLKV